MDYRSAENALLIEVCRRFFSTDQKPIDAREVAKAISEEWGLKPRLTREKIYPLIREARRRGLIRLVPPLDDAVREAVAKRYRLPEERLRVVPARGSGALEIVATSTAEVVLDLIRKIGGTKERVHLGLGAGGTMKEVAGKLAELLRSEPALPKLAFHALSTGCDVKRPDTAPVSFFSAFRDVADDIKYYGLFAPAFVPTRNYKREIE
jgi:hypothetical protein